MFSLRRPTPQRLARWLARQTAASVFTRAAEIPRPAPRGFRLNEGRALLGRGEQVFDAARCALADWQMFPGGWVSIWPAERVALDATVAVLAHCLGVWSANACRVVNIADERDNEAARYAFTYATVAGHVYRGAEQFAVTWNRRTDEVWYELVSYSQPRHPLVRLLSPYTRGLQRRFARESAAALQAAVLAQTPPAATSCETPDAVSPTGG